MTTCLVDAGHRDALTHEACEVMPHTQGGVDRARPVARRALLAGPLAGKLDAEPLCGAAHRPLAAARERRIRAAEVAGAVREQMPNLRAEMSRMRVDRR